MDIADCYKLNLLDSDPLSIILTRKLNLTPMRILGWMLFVAAIWRVVIPLSFNMPFPPSLDGTILSFIEIPFFWAYFIWSKVQIANLFDSISRNRLLKNSSKEKYMRFMEKLQNTFSQKWLYILAAIISMLFTLIQIFMYYPNNPNIWYEPYKFPLYAIGEMTIYTLSQYIVITIVLIELILIRQLKVFFDDFSIRVHFDFPDRAGGWGEIGKHAIGISLFSVVFAIWMIGMTISAEARFAYPMPVKVFFWTLFSLGSPVVFFAPLLSAHSAMNKYKFDMLKEVSEKTNSLFENSKEKLSSPEFDIQGTMRHMRELQEWKDYLNNAMPSWPFPKKSFPSIAASWFLPLTSGLLTTYLDAYVRNFLGL